VAASSLDLRLPVSERRLAAMLTAGWRDFLYVPGEGFTSPLDPGAYRSSFVVVPAAGAPVRLSSLVVPAFGGELCRLHLEPIECYRPESFGSFFDPTRTGRVYALTPDRAAGAPRAPERAEWRYDGPPLAARLGRLSGARILRERGRGTGFSWEADRGVVLAGADGTESLLLSVAEHPETMLFLSSPGLYRALLDAGALPRPGVTARGLLGYGEWPGALDITVELVPI
jgi:hypothetical protein